MQRRKLRQCPGTKGVWGRELIAARTLCGDLYYIIISLLAEFVDDDGGYREGVAARESMIFRDDIPPL